MYATAETTECNTFTFHNFSYRDHHGQTLGLCGTNCEQRETTLVSGKTCATNSVRKHVVIDN